MSLLSFVRPRLIPIACAFGIVACAPHAEAIPADCGFPLPPRNELRKFRIFDATLYRNKPDLSPHGIEPITVHYGEMWKSPQRYHELPEENTIRELARKPPVGPSPVVLDVEQWRLRMAPDDEIAESKRKLKALVRMFKLHAPTRQFGFYSLLPLRDYWRAINGPNTPGYREWQRENDGVKVLEPEVDVLFPSLYTFYENQASWRLYAIAQICEARRISSKPVYAFIWPEYHDSNERLSGTYLPPEYWRMQLEVLRPLADGVVIWGGYDGKNRRPKDWNDRAAWWGQTKEFAKSILQ